MKKEYTELTDFDLKEMLSAINSTPKYVWIWWDIENFFINWLSLKRWHRRIKFFFQRLIRGFDDSETWEMDESLLHWLLPRLKRFNKLNNGYPDCYETFENWKNEIDRRIIQIERLLNINEFSFPYHEYLTKEDLKNIKKYHGKGIVEQRVYNSYAYNSCRNDFMEWLKNNLIHLWW